MALNYQQSFMTEGGYGGDQDAFSEQQRDAMTLMDGLIDKSNGNESSLNAACANGTLPQQIAVSLAENKKLSLEKVKEFSVQAKQLGDLFSNYKLQRQS